MFQSTVNPITRIRGMDTPTGLSFNCLHCGTNILGLRYVHIKRSWDQIFIYEDGHIVTAAYRVPRVNSCLCPSSFEREGAIE